MPQHAFEYASEKVRLVRSTCLYIATKLGDLRDEIIVVGGLVPSLLIPQEVLQKDAVAHVGTLDLDLGLAVALLEEKRYRTLAQRLRAAGFTQDRSDAGNPTRQRWRVANPLSATVDFLIAPSSEADNGGALRHLENDFAAIITPGLHLAFADRRLVRISGQTPFGETATRDIWVCGPGAFTVLKAIAFFLRGENKDAYDLYYVLRNFGKSVNDVAHAIVPLLSDSKTLEALDVLRRDFSSPDALGPLRVAQFLFGRADDETQADVVGFAEELLKRCK